MRDQLIHIFESFAKKNILIVGDVMIDAYVWGEVTRISPEAPVPILSKATHEARLGGAGNVALNIRSLGATPILCTIIGDDEKAKLLDSLLTENGLSGHGIIKDSTRITTVKTRLISQTHHLLRVDEEDSTRISPQLENRLIGKVRQIVENEKIDAIVFEDYDKGVITPTVIEGIVNFAKTLNIPTLVDPKKRNFLAYKEVSFFKPNLKEFKEGLGIEFAKSDKTAIEKAAKSYLEQTGTQHIMVTMAEQGVFICGHNNHAFFPAQVRNIADVSGAGDTVISVSALCLASGLPIPLVAQIANMAGGMVCEKPGVVPIDKNHLLQECLAKIPDYAE
ncbi:MAG: PfkB family carbohydrate kinase [Breznakibacter sp.]